MSRVLVVEDDQDIADLIATTCRRRGTLVESVDVGVGGDGQGARDSA